MAKKSKRKELQESNENARKAIDESIEMIKDHAEYIPLLHERKMELEANSRLIESADDAEIDEVYSKLLPLQRHDEEGFAHLSVLLGNVSDEMGRVYPSTSGTSTAYISFAYSLNQNVPTPHIPIHLIYKDVIEYKAHKAEIPKKLSQLHDDLGTMFSSVHDNVYKAKNGVMTVKQAVSDMRDVLNQIWANLADWSFNKCPENWRGINNKQFKNSGHRNIVVECLIEDQENRGKCELLLDNMYILFREMSDTSIGKNPLSQDYSKLDEFYTRWVSQIDGVIGLIDWGED